MAYIGKEPVVGNFQVCDSISVVNGQAAYTLQVSSTNVVPESSQHCLVSLNGILQAPVTSFTVSGSTLTFASNLATGDVIDFVMLLGNVLDLGTPSDGTVTNAKLSGDLISGETDIGGAIADADLMLLDDGAGGTLRKSAMSRVKTYIGAANTPMFSARLSSNQSVSDGTATTVAFATEHYDTGSDFNNSTYKWTVPETAKYLMNIRLAFDSSAEFFSSLSIVKDGTGDIYSVQMGHDEASDSITGTVIASLTATHVYYITAYQSSGGSINLIGNEQQSEFSVFKLIS